MKPVPTPDGAVDPVQTALHQMRAEQEILSKLRENVIPHQPADRRSVIYIDDHLSVIGKHESAITGLKIQRFFLVIFALALLYKLCEPHQEIQLQEGTATRIDVKSHHWFSTERYFLEARANPDEENEIQWAKPDGKEWYFVNSYWAYEGNE